MTSVKNTVRSRWVLPALVLLAMLTPSFAFFFSRHDSAQETSRLTHEVERLSIELDAARGELQRERAKDDCILALHANYLKADSAWSDAFTELVVGLAVRGDIPTLIAGIDAANANKQAAFEAYDKQIGC